MTPEERHAQLELLERYGRYAPVLIGEIHNSRTGQSETRIVRLRLARQLLAPDENIACVYSWFSGYKPIHRRALARMLHIVLEQAQGRELEPMKMVPYLQVGADTPTATSIQPTTE